MHSAAVDMRKLQPASSKRMISSSKSFMRFLRVQADGFYRELRARKAEGPLMLVRSEMVLNKW